MHWSLPAQVSYSTHDLAFVFMTLPVLAFDSVLCVGYFSAFVCRRLKRLAARIFVVLLCCFLVAGLRKGGNGSVWQWLGLAGCDTSGRVASLSNSICWCVQVCMIIVWLQGSLAVTSTANQVGTMATAIVV